MALNLGQAEVASDEHRFKCIVAGRRWGKTYLATRELARQARFPDRRVWYIAPSYRMAKQIVWQPLKWRLQDLRWAQKINESELTITLRNGSTIALRGADNPDSLRGVGLDFMVMDEFAMIDENAWTEVLRPTLSDRNGSAMFISTPMGIHNWAYDLYNRQNEDAAWRSWSFKTIDGGRVSEEEIAQARRDLSDRQFRQEYEATFETYSGRIYYNFERAQNVKPFTMEIPREVLIFCDFNVNPISACVAIFVGEQQLHVIDEIVIWSSNTDELVDEIKNRYPNKSVRVYPDPAGVQRKTSAGGRTDITILENAGFRVFYHRSHPLVRDRINAVNAAFKNTDGEVNLWIDPRCRRVIESLEKQVYKENTQIPEKGGDQDFSHMNDALGYGVQYLRPIRKEHERRDEPTVWRHQTQSVRSQ